MEMTESERPYHDEDEDKDREKEKEDRKVLEMPMKSEPLIYLRLVLLMKIKGLLNRCF